MDTATAFLQSFLESYVPRCESLDMSDANRMAIVSFAHAWCNWDESVSVPFDMFSKYLEHAVRNVYVSDTRPQHEKLTAAGEFVPKKQGVFLDKVLDAAAVKDFARNYAGGVYYTKFSEWSATGKGAHVVSINEGQVTDYGHTHIIVSRRRE